MLFNPAVGCGCKQCKQQPLPSRLFLFMPRKLESRSKQIPGLTSFQTGETAADSTSSSTSDILSRTNIWVHRICDCSFYPDSLPDANARARMIPSPSKRRKSNSSIPIPVGASHTARRDGRGRTSPSRSPSRRSFQAPTRSSLARYHPDVLSKAIERSASEKAQRSSGQEFSSFGEHIGSSPQISGSIPLRPHVGASHTEPEEDDGLPRLNSTISRPGSRRRSFGELPFPGEISRVKAPDKPGEKRGSASISSTGSHDAGQGLSLSPPEADPPPRGTIAHFNGSPSQRSNVKRKQQLKKEGFYPIFKNKNTKATDPKRSAGEPRPGIGSEPDKELPKEIQENQKVRDSLREQLERLKEEVELLEKEAGQLETTEHESVDESSLRRLMYVSGPQLCILLYQVSHYTNLSYVVDFSCPKTRLVHLRPLNRRHLLRCLRCFHICSLSQLSSQYRCQNPNHHPRRLLRIPMP